MIQPSFHPIQIVMVVTATVFLCDGHIITANMKSLGGEQAERLKLNSEVPLLLKI